mgnify:CR=1 FL=1
MIPVGPGFQVMGPELEVIRAVRSQCPKSIVEGDVKEDSAGKHAEKIDDPSQ